MRVRLFLDSDRRHIETDSPEMIASSLSGITDIQKKFIMGATLTLPALPRWVPPSPVSRARG